MKEQIKQLIDKNEIISFDIFDTLLFRNVYSPSDIFKLVAKKMDDEIKNFYDLRISSESKARKHVPNFECTLDEIYDEISKEVGKTLSAKAKKIELDLEQQFIDVNPFMHEIFEYALSKEKKVYLISDMYLPSKIICKLLKKAGYKTVPLYVSCEYRKSKGTGELYDIVQRENNLDKTKWLHIGDNKISDYERPIEFGINAYKYKNIREYDMCITPNSIEESIITAIQYNYLYNGTKVDYWSKFGILYISPIYFGFTDWLYKMTNDLDNLFFLARDGYIIQKIYEMFPKTDKYIKYIYCSRKSIQIPSLLNQEDDYIVHMLTMKNDVVKKEKSLKEMFEVAQLKCDNKYIQIIKQFGFHSFNDIVTENKYNNAKKLIARLLPDIKKNLLEQNKLAIDYLNQEGMSKFDKINIVDIGWGGSIQYSISKLLNKKTNGYYFGTIYTPEKENWYSSTFGWYFDMDNDPVDKQDVLDQVMMYELIFSAPHGTTIKYETKDKIVPVLGADDNSKIIEQFQNSAINIIKKYMEYYEYFDVIDKHFCLNRYKKYIDSKNYQDMIMFSNLSNDLVLGSNKKYPYVYELTKNEVINNYKEFNNKRNKSIWKGAYKITDIDNPKDLEKIIKKMNQNDKFKLKLQKIRRKLIPLKLRKKILEIYKSNRLN